MVPRSNHVRRSERLPLMFAHGGPCSDPLLLVVVPGDCYTRPYPAWWN